MKKLNLYLVLLLLISGFTVDAQAPANDDCSGATAMNFSPNVFYGGTTVNAVNMVSPSPSCHNSGQYDVWYSFTAGSAGEILVEILHGTNTLVVRALVLYTGTCGNLTAVQCMEINTFDCGRFKASGLTPGNTYYLQIVTDSQQGGWGIKPVDHLSPNNDDCTGAITLNMGNYISGFSENASNNVNPSPGCHNGGQYDIWYKFVAPASGMILLKNLYYLNSVVLYSGSCGSLTPLQCLEQNENTGGQVCAELFREGLTPGNTYYIQVVTDAPQCNIGVQIINPANGPANDFCSGAIPVAVGAQNSCPAGQVSGTTVNAMHNGAVTCASNQHQCNYLDVWYSFTAPSNGALKYIPGTNNPAASFFSGDCNTLTPVGCLTAQGTLELTPGVSYLLKISTLVYNGESGLPFSFCLETGIPPPANNSCGGAVAVAVSANGACSPVSGTTVAATLNMNFPCAFGGSEQYLDVFYSFTAPAGGVVTFHSGTNNPFATIYSGSCGSLSVITNGCMRGSGTVSNLNPGSTYYLQVLTSGGTGKVFDFCLEVSSPAPSNNGCQNAIPVNLNTPITVNSLYGRTLALPPCAPLPSLNAPDLWYTFTGPEDGVLGYSFGGGTILMSVYSGSCGNLTGIVCGVPLAGSAPSNLVPGQTYYAQLSSLGATTNGTATISGIVPCTQFDWYADTDNDGYGAGAPTSSCTQLPNTVTNNTDCQPTVSSINPGASEVCNNVDDDCDLNIDEGLPTNTYYQDNDHDGKGNPAVSVVACSQPPGYVSNSLDCDDNSTMVCPKPGGMMSSNITDISATVSWGNMACANSYRLEYRRKTPPISNWTVVYTNTPSYNITGLTGPNILYQWRVASICTPGGTGAESGYATPIQSFKTKYKVYIDGDLDGYGSTTVAYVIPFPQTGYASNNTDCDDAVSTTRPGAPELCNGIDDDCDLTVDEGTNWYQDLDGDGLGNGDVSQNACLQPAGYVSNSADCNDESTTPSCATPTGITVTNTGTTFATVNWSDIPCAASYTLMYRNPAGVWSTQFNTSGNSVMLTGLSPATTYQARVRSKCPSPNTVTTSNWVYYSFTTLPLPMGLTENTSEIITSMDMNFELYPNPGDGVFNLRLSSEVDGEAKIFVSDAFGKLVYSNNWSVNEGQNIDQFDLSFLAGGVYQVSVQQGNLLRTKKVLVLK